MKKFLSLVLALVMTMSLVTVSAGAKDFTDSSKITYAEAVDVMSAVKVIDGYAEGDFRPTATLTRGAAAKIICNLILGPTTAAALVADTAPYKDVPTNHTFAGYIAYCQKEGIISGYADGTFRPAASLTGYAFMKMLLGALGYDAEVEQYTGPNWSVNVAKRALFIGLADDLVGDFNGIKAVTREEACLYALNTMTANMVEYASKTSVTAGSTTVVVTGSNAKDMEVVNAKTDGHVFTADRIVQFAEKYFTDLTVQKDTDDFGRPSNTWKNKSEKIGTYADKADLTYTKAVKANEIYKDLALTDTVKTGKVTVYINGEDVAAAKQDIAKANDTKIGKNVYPENGTDGNGVLTEVFYNKKTDSIVITQVITYVGEVVKTVPATDKKDAYIVLDFKENASTGKNNYRYQPYSLVAADYAKDRDFETDEKFADETYVLYTCSFKDDSKGEIKSVKAAQKVEGYVTKTINNSNDVDKNNGMTIAGTDYKMSLSTAGDGLGYVSVKKDYTVYLDEYGYIIYVEEINEIGNYALLLATATATSFVGDKAQLLTSDGKIKFVDTDENYNGKIARNTIVTFRENSDKTYTLREAQNFNTTDKKYENGTKVVTNAADFKLTNDKAGISVTATNISGKANGGIVNANSATTFVVADQVAKTKRDQDGNIVLPNPTTEWTTVFTGSDYTNLKDWTSYTGIKNAPSIDDGKGDDGRIHAYYFCKSGKMVTVMFIVPDSLATVEDEGKATLYVAKKSKVDLTHDESGSYFQYNVVRDGKLETIKVADKVTVDGASMSGGDLNGVYKTYSTNSKGYITSLTKYAAYKGNTDQGAAVDNGIGIDKVSKEYTVILDTYDTSVKTVVNAPSSYTGKNLTITCADNAKFFTVDGDGKITETTYSGIRQDENDRVFAYVKDYMVQTLIVQEIDNNPWGGNDPNGGMSTGGYELSGFSDLFTTVSGAVSGDAEYNADTGMVYVQLQNDANGSNYKATYNLTIRDNKGRTKRVSDKEFVFGNVTDNKTTASKVYGIPFKASANATNVTVAVSNEKITDLYVSYNVASGINVTDRTKTVKNVAGEKITFTINAPEGAAEWQYNVSDNNPTTIKVATPTVGVTTLGTAVTGITAKQAKVAVELHTAGTMPEVKIDGVSVDKYDLTETVAEGAAQSGISVVKTDGAKTIDKGGAMPNVTVYLDKAGDTNDQIKVTYKLNGDVKTKSVAVANTNVNQTVALDATGAVTKATTLEITKVELMKKVTFTNVNTSGNLTAEGVVTVKDSKGNDVTSNSTFVAVGEKLTVTVKPVTVEDKGVKLTCDGVAKDFATSAAEATFTYTMKDDTNTITVATDDLT